MILDGQLPPVKTSQAAESSFVTTSSLWFFLVSNEALRQQERQRQGRQAEPSAAIIDSQSAKTTEAGGQRGYDAGKKVNGRQRHILVDTLGHVLAVVVHAANIQDRDGATLLLEKLPQRTQEAIRKIWADGGYRGQLIDWVQAHLNIILAIVERDPDQKGFQVLPHRWVVERTFAWFGRYRRLSKDYEHCTENSEGMIYLASIHTLMRSLCYCLIFKWPLRPDTARRPALPPFIRNGVLLHS